MFVFSNFLNALVSALDLIANALGWLIVIRALLSWVNPDPSNPIVQFVERSTEWLLVPFRRILPTHNIGIDLSPLLAWLFIRFFVQAFLLHTLGELAYRIG